MRSNVWLAVQVHNLWSAICVGSENVYQFLGWRHFPPLVLYAPWKSSSVRPSGFASRARSPSPSPSVRLLFGQTDRREGTGSRDCHVRMRESERARPSVDPDLGWTTHLVAHWKNKPFCDLFPRWDIVACLIMLPDTIYKSYLRWKHPSLVTWVEKRNTCIWQPAVRPFAAPRSGSQPAWSFIAEIHGGNERGRLTGLHLCWRRLLDGPWCSCGTITSFRLND